MGERERSLPQSSNKFKLGKMANSVNKKECEQSSKRHFHWTTKISSNEDEDGQEIKQTKEAGAPASMMTTEKKGSAGEKWGRSKSKKVDALALVFRLRSLFSSNTHQRVVLGTLFGNKRGHVHFAFQKDAKSDPTLLLQLATPITGLVREMECGSIRITLESEKKEKKNGVLLPLLEERAWRTYYNGLKCGTATRIECGAKERKILKSVEPISMGAGVLPAEGDEEEVIYMRSKFERVVGSAHSEALYMLNPDNNVKAAAAPPPELSIYLLRL